MPREPIIPQLNNDGVNAIDIAWLAGIIDGEGTVQIHLVRESGYHQCKVNIVNTDEGILTEVKRILKEWLVFFTISKNNQPEHKPCYVIGINRQLEAKFVLGKVLPYLKSVKKQKAELFIEFVNNCKRIDGKKSNRRQKELQHAFV